MLNPCNLRDRMHGLRSKANEEVCWGFGSGCCCSDRTLATAVNLVRDLLIDQMQARC